MNPESIEELLTYAGYAAGVYLVLALGYFLIKTELQKIRWRKFASQELIDNLRGVIEDRLPKGLTVKAFRIYPRTWKNDPLFVEYNADENPSDWIRVRSITIPRKKIYLNQANSRITLKFRGGRVEINKDIDFDEMSNALGEFLTEKWPVKDFFIVAVKGKAIHVYQFIEDLPMNTDTPRTYLRKSYPISEVPKYLEH